MKLWRRPIAAFGLVLVAGTLFWAGGRAGGRAGDRAEGESGGSAPAMGVLYGQAIFWPPAPVEGPGIPGKPRPAAGVRIMVRDAAGVVVATVTTGQEGRYRLELPPGAYRLEMAPGGPGRHTKDLPAAITIFPGKETRKDIRVDTGLRSPAQK